MCVRGLKNNVSRDRSAVGEINEKYKYSDHTRDGDCMKLTCWPPARRVAARSAAKILRDLKTRDGRKVPTYCLYQFEEK